MWVLLWRWQYGAALSASLRHAQGGAENCCFNLCPGCRPPTNLDGPRHFQADFLYAREHRSLKYVRGLNLPLTSPSPTGEKLKTSRLRRLVFSFARIAKSAAKLPQPTSVIRQNWQMERPATMSA